MANDETAKYITANRKLLIAAIDLAAIMVFGEEKKDNVPPAISKMVEFYMQVRKETQLLMSSAVPPEHCEYLVITEFTRVFTSIVDPESKQAAELIMYTGADILLLDKRANITFSLRPWVVLFERFLDSQKDKEWGIPVALFASWTKPDECMFSKSDMSIIIRSHLAALGRRLSALDSDEATYPMRDLISADSQVMITSASLTHGRGKPASKKAKPLLNRAKRNLIDTCHRTLTNISLYRNKEGLGQ